MPRYEVEYKKLIHVKTILIADNQKQIEDMLLKDGFYDIKIKDIKN